ncbi:MAG: matrixin family metalloprotease [Candidatus Zixiibacteriota bacterium]
MKSRKINILVIGAALMTILAVGSSTFAYGTLDYYYNDQIRTEHWPSVSNIPWYMNDLTPAYASACQASVDNWKNITYTDLTHQYLGTTSVAYNYDDGVNVLSWAADGLVEWNWGAIAFATNYVVESTGEIYGFDVLMNPKKKWSYDGTPRNNEYEIEAILTHELGHSWGLCHSMVGTATMYPFVSTANTSQTTLEHDDIISHALVYNNGTFPGSYAKFTGSVVRGGTGVPVAGACVHSFPENAGYYSDNITNTFTYTEGTYTLYVPAGTYWLRVDPLDGDPSAYSPNRISYVLMDIAETNFPAEWYNNGESNCEEDALVSTYSISSGQTLSGFNFITNENCTAKWPGDAPEQALIPAEFSMGNYPNPFNPSTIIKMSLPYASDWSISIYDILGRKVADFRGYSEAGEVSVEWDASEQASGIYFYKGEASEFSGTQKMLLIK